MGDVHCLDSSDTDDQMKDETLNISDVIEVIETDTDFKPSLPAKTMFTAPATNVEGNSRRQAVVRIIEQPASKKLRFRYECEGRSAGSIPGSNSTAENKTFPSIQIMGYKGKAVVVVSCVTKDPPYRPHPHNLVGREGCRKGVCTLEIPQDTMSITFSNLGIQCVKKKDIESHLKIREEIRVDPFKTGFHHRNQPTSIDLNAVRLCFQVFIEGSSGKFSEPLKPVVSDTIYDKKAMSDLIIIKLSDCVSTVDGGRKDIILLCEKVTKEDIQIRFFEDKNGETVWEGFGDFQPSQVHKQTAIWFKAPRYKDKEITEPVKAFIQLRRPSDGATSEALPFEFLPLDSGRPSFWSSRRNYSKKGNYDLFSSILAKDVELTRKRQLSSLFSQVEPTKELAQTEVPTYGEIKKNKPSESINDIINDVVELDEIYSENRILLEKANLEQPVIENQESFDDSKTYSSLQMAFKSPLEIVEIDLDKYEDITPVTTPIIPEPEKLPPLPPKRAKKVIETDICDAFIPPLKESLDSCSINSSVQIERTKSQIDLAPIKSLPPKPTSTLPNPKKRGFFSKIFNRKEKIIEPSKRYSLTDNRLLQPNVIRSPSMTSTHSNLSVRIPLKGSLNGLNNLNINSSNELNNENNCDNIVNINEIEDDFNMNLDLTEAEHYALYTAMAPHATQSEFDEMSAYYAPVEGGIHKRKRNKYDQDPNSNLLRPQEYSKANEPYGILTNIPVVDKVKIEPRDQSQTPYVSPNYVGNISPMYTPNPSISPNPMWINSAQPQNVQYNIVYSPNNNLNPITQSNVLPPISNVLSQYMTNIPSTSNINNFEAETAMAMSVDNSGIGLSSLLNMDSQQLQQINLNSGDLTFDTNNLSENFTNNLSLTEGTKNQNMTDSLTRLAQTTYDNMVGNNIQ